MTAKINKTNDGDTIYYLEMGSAQDLNPSERIKELELIECQIKQYEFNQFLYQIVGAKWRWFDRLDWSEEQWKAAVECDSVRTWVAYYKGAPAGYFELQQEPGGDVQILYIGLVPRFIGQGLGGDLLTRAIDQAWQLKNTIRVLVHTCSFDHPSALTNYKMRGMNVYHTELIVQDN